MDLLTLLQMVADAMPGRVLIGKKDSGLTAEQLRHRASAFGAFIRDLGAETVVYLGGNDAAFPVSLFGSAAAHVPFLPVNYRLSDEQLGEILRRQNKALVLTSAPKRVVGLAPDLTVMSIDELMKLSDVAADLVAADPESIALLLMTSGTTAAPKSAVLRHHHLTSYVLGAVDFAAADEADATIVSVPPYHIAAVANLLSNLFAGRRIVYLDRFTAGEWLDIVEHEGITNAMLVPTMLARIVRELEESGQTGPKTLRTLSYGGAKMAAPVLESALRLFPETGFVNAYGLTETSSTIAVLGPDDHREALASEDAEVRARLGSAGRPLPEVTIEVHDEDGKPCATRVVGDIVVRGPQVAGEYLEGGTRLDKDGWFPTRDRGYLDEGGYLFIQGRSDDIIIRAGENVAPAEIEDVLLSHPAVSECAIAGVPDEEWGQRIAAFVVLKPDITADADELRDYVRAHLRSSKTPDIVQFLTDLPHTATGKLLRRQLVVEYPARQATGIRP